MSGNGDEQGRVDCSSTCPLCSARDSYAREEVAILWILRPYMKELQDLLDGAQPAAQLAAQGGDELAAPSPVLKTMLF